MGCPPQDPTRRHTLWPRWLLLASVASASPVVQAQAPNLPISGHVRLQQDDQQPNTTLAAPLPVPTGSATAQTELRASGPAATAVVTLQQRQQGTATQSRAWVNELYATHDGGAWQFSAGKRVVSWDVGYGFRPNDVVQQEQRLGLASSTLEGRPVLVAEHFSADAAWTFAWVNPTGAAQDAAGREPALAARLYQQQGAVDWHGFARVGAYSGASVGAAATWVATDALALHGSVRVLNHSTTQVVLGGNWTAPNQLGVLLETWRDGTAQAGRNSLLRISWTSEGWSPTLDVLYAPADQGRTVTAALAWQGDRVNVQGALRVFGGPAGAAVMQLPVRRQAYVALTWAF